MRFEYIRQRIQIVLQEGAGCHMHQQLRQHAHFGIADAPHDVPRRQLVRMLQAGCLHQFHERMDDTLVYCAWFAGGLRIVDIADPTAPQEVGHYIPEPLHGQAGPVLTAIQHQASSVAFTCIVAGQIGVAMACRSERRSAFGELLRQGWRTNPLLWFGVAVEVEDRGVDRAGEAIVAHPHD